MRANTLKYLLKVTKPGSKYCFEVDNIHDIIDDVRKTKEQSDSIFLIL